MKRVLVLCVLLALIATAGSSFAAIPRTISYQGVLKNTDGSVVDDGVYDVMFRIYDAEGGSALALWTEVQSVSVAGGLFYVILGKVEPIDLPFDEAYWLGISVGEDPELEPRLELAGSPYAFRAAVGADDDWQISGDDVYRLTGEVGIGTAYPSMNLHIRENVNGIVGLKIENRNTGSSSSERISFTDENGDICGIATRDDDSTTPSAMTIFNNRPGGRLRFNTAGVERMRVANSGYVGIGTQSPYDLLHVAGTVRLSGLRMSSGASDGHVLTSDSDGVASWQRRLGRERRPGVQGPEHGHRHGGALRGPGAERGVQRASRRSLGIGRLRNLRGASGEQQGRHVLDHQHRERPDRALRENGG